MSKEKITAFFAQRKQLQFPTETRTETVQDKFYRECIEADKSKCKKSECAKKKSVLEARAKDLIAKCELHKEQIKICSNIISIKNREIEALQNQLEKSQIDCSKEILSNNATDEIESDIQSSYVVRPDISSEKPLFDYSDFQNFSLEQLANFRSIGHTVREDSTFILAVVRALYEEKLEVLQG